MRRQKCFVAKLRRLQNRHAGFERQLLGRRRHDVLPASLRAVRLRHERHDVMTRVDQRPQRRHREPGVPKYTIRSGASVYHRARALELVDFADDQVLLDPAQPIDEDGAVEVIHLVLKRPREQLAPFDRLLGARFDRGRERPPAPAGRPWR